MKTVQISLGEIQNKLLEMGPQNYGRAHYRLNVYSDGAWNIQAGCGNYLSYREIGGEQETAVSTNLVSEYDNWADGWSETDEKTKEEYEKEAYEEYVLGQFDNELKEKIENMISEHDTAYNIELVD